MKRHMTRIGIVRRAVTSISAACLVTAAFAVNAAGQVDLRIRVPVKPPINKNPLPKSPPATSPNENRTQPSPNGNRPPVSVGGGTVNTGGGTVSTGGAGSGGGATREEINSFLNDLREFIKSRGGGRAGTKGLHLLKNMAAQANKPNFSGCHADTAHLRAALEDGAAFAEIVKAKYPNIENPNWTTHPDSMAGDWRRAVENRSEIVKNCVTVRFAAELRSKVQGLEKELAQFKTERSGEWAGFVLSRNFDDPAAGRAALLEKYKEAYALVGVTMPDDTVFAEYDAALKALVDEAKSRAGEWKWYWNHHDPAIEAKIRSRFAAWEPRGRIVKIGLMHSDWQIDGPSGGIPRGRYKRAYVMYRKPGLQQCVLAAFSYEQSYAGGGRFEDSVTTGFTPSVRLQNCN
jgi:hypothetical protein